MAVGLSKCYESKRGVELGVDEGGRVEGFEFGTENRRMATPNGN